MPFTRSLNLNIAWRETEFILQHVAIKLQKVRCRGHSHMELISAVSNLKQMHTITTHVID